MQQSPPALSGSGAPCAGHSAAATALEQPPTGATEAVLPSPAEADLLLTFKAGIDNWDEVVADRKWDGWDCASGADCTPVCAWGGVTCNPYHVHEGNFVNELRLGCNGCGVKMRGRLLPGIQRLQHLELLYLDNNEVGGQECKGRGGVR